MARYDEDERGGRGRDRDDDRGGRDRDRSSSRDDDRGSRDRGRGRDDDEPNTRRTPVAEAARGGRGRDDDDDRGSRRGGGQRYQYEARSTDQHRKRQEQGPGDFDRILKDTIKMWKVNDGNNTIRPLAPTWKKAEHFGYDIYVHYGVGPDRATYLCLFKMLGKPCPICEERTEVQRSGDEKLAKQMEPKRRVLIYLIDRDKEKEGVQAWAMPWTVDRDISKVSQDRRTGEVLPIDHPEDGYDVMFEKKGAKDRTEYLAIQLDRRPSDLGKPEWMDFAIEHPLPDQLQYFDYEHIAKAFNGGGTGGGSRDRDDDRDRDRDRGSSRDDDRGSSRGRDRDDDRPTRRGRDDDDRPARREEPKYDFNQVNDMSSRELDALADEVGVNASKFNDDRELAEAICEKLGLTAEPRRRSPGRDDDEPPKRGRGDEDNDDRLRRMRGDDDDRPRRSSRDDDEPPRRGRGDDDDRPVRRRSEEDEPVRRRSVE